MSFHRMQSRHDTFRKFVLGFIGLVFVLIIAMFGFMGYIAFEAFDMIQAEGLKGVVDTIWNGVGK